MKYVLLYEAVDDFRPKALQLFEQHRALWRQFLEVGTLLMVGNFTNEPAGGAMALFTTREAAEGFAAQDQFVKQGVVARFRIRERNEVLVK